MQDQGLGMEIERAEYVATKSWDFEWLHEGLGRGINMSGRKTAEHGDDE